MRLIHVGHVVRPLPAVQQGANFFFSVYLVYSGGVVVVVRARARVCVVVVVVVVQETTHLHRSHLVSSF